MEVKIKYKSLSSYVEEAPIEIVWLSEKVGGKKA